MTALKQLQIEHLRGAVTPFTLPFEKGKKLTVVYGENATGKSTICDALELLGRGEVNSLENRGLGSTLRYWPSLGKKPSDIAVTLETGDGSCRATVTIAGEVMALPPERRPRVEVFRRSQIASLIEATPADRYKAISRFIDVSGIEASEGTLKKLVTELKDSQKLAIAGLAENEAAIRDFWETAGRPGSDPFAWAEAECRQDSGVSEAESAALHALQLAYAPLTGIPESLKTAQQNLKAAEQSAAQAVTALEEAAKSASKDAREVVAVLRAAQSYLKQVSVPGVCPLCESAENVATLSTRIQNRLSDFAAVQEAQSAAEAASLKADRLRQQLEAARKLAKEQVTRFQETLDAFEWPAGIPLPPRPVPTTAAGLDAWLLAGVDLPAEWKKAEVQRHDRKQFIETLARALKTWQANRKSQVELANLLPRLERALVVVMDERRRFTDEILTSISAEVGRLYEAVHPGEGLNRIGMELDAKKRASLELAASFSGMVTRPQAYFSDSHLDTLGLCVLLSLAALDEPEATILVLDDVLASVDEPHVERLIEMLYAEVTRFRHCILTTHYRPWREKFRWGWLRHGQCQFVELMQPPVERAMALTRSVPDIERLEKLLAETHPDLQAICSQAGVILEAALNFLTLHYECSVPRRPGGHYTLGDLLPALDKKLVQSLRVDVMDGKNAQGVAAYRTVKLQPFIETLARIAQARNVFGCHFNELSYELLDADALTFGRQVFDVMTVLTDGDAGWPRNGKSGEYWATAGETRRLYPFKKPS